MLSTIVVAIKLASISFLLFFNCFLSSSALLGVISPALTCSLINNSLLSIISLTASILALEEYMSRINSGTTFSIVLSVKASTSLALSKTILGCVFRNLFQTSISLPFNISLLAVSIVPGCSGKTSFNTICLLKSTSAIVSTSTILFAFSVASFSLKNFLVFFLAAVPSFIPTYEFM